MKRGYCDIATLMNASRIVPATQRQQLINYTKQKQKKNIEQQTGASSTRKGAMKSYEIQYMLLRLK